MEQSRPARFESGTSSKSPGQCSVQSHSPTNLNVHLAVGLSREKEMPKQDAAIQLNLAWSGQEVKRQNNKLHLVTFQNKTLRVDTSTHHEASCLPYCAWLTQTATGGDCQKAEQNRIGATTQRTPIQWKLGRLISHCHG